MVCGCSNSLEERCKHIWEAEQQASVLEAQQPRSPLDGNELIAIAGRDPGPWVGELKDYLQSLVAAGNLNRNDKEQAAAIAREWLWNYEP